LLPVQNEFELELIVTEGALTTVITCEAVEEPQELEAVTEYVPAEETVIELLVDPMLHK
jgi:hypothetical protein